MTPEQRVALEEEREHLLGSLEDLESEFSAGDMDEQDYQTLKEEYTLRAAQVLRKLDPGSTKVKVELSPQADRSGGPRWRTAAVVLGVLAFAALAGVLVARGSGQRGDNAITGDTGTLRQQLATCQTTSFQKPADGIECYDEILAQAPENLEALTYQGWAYVRSDQPAKGQANFDKVIALDPSYADVRVFRASVAATARDYQTAAQELETFYASSPPAAAVQVLQSQGLERKIFFGLLDSGTRECWQQAAETQQQGEQFNQQFLDTLGTCLQAELVKNPQNVDALVSLALSKVGPEVADLPAANELLQTALQIAPEFGDALLLRASLAAADSRFNDAQTDLAGLQALPRPKISFLIGGPETLSESIAAAERAATTTTSPTSSSSTTTTNSPTTSSRASDSRIPNPNGG
jgi:tetratricopeptide (TPR) repeat protein